MIRVLLRFLLSLTVASIAIFVMLRIIPGDPARIALGVNATPEAVDELSAQLGTNTALITQYLRWVGGMLTGDFGTSLSSGYDLTPLIIDRAQVSLILCLSALIISLIIAVALGTWAAVRHNKADAQVLSVLSQLGIAIPSFLTALLLVSVVSVHWGVVPASGWVPPGQDVGAFLTRLILPVLSLSAVQSAILTRYVRSAMLDVIHSDFLRTSQAIGASRIQVMLRHGLRNAAIPVLTVLGVQMTSLIVGAVVIEHVFSLPGLGSMLLDAVANRDLPAVQSIVMLLVTFSLSITMCIDVAYRLIDPRLRRSRSDSPEVLNA